MTAKLGFLGQPRDGWIVRGTLFDVAGREVLSDPLAGPVKADANTHNPYRAPLGKVTLQAEVPAPARWSSETPTLYTLVVSLHDGDGPAVEATSCRVGFRRVELGDRELLINGKAVMIAGMNRHEHHPVRGKAVTRADMIADITLMKRFNVNAVDHFSQLPGGLRDLRRVWPLSGRRSQYRGPRLPAPALLGSALRHAVPGTGPAHGRA